MKALYVQTDAKTPIPSSLLSVAQFDVFYSDRKGSHDQLKRCLNQLGNGDTLYIERESCLARTMPEAVGILSSLAKRGVNVWCSRNKKLLDSATSPYRDTTEDHAQAVIDFRNAFSRVRQDRGIIKARLAGKIMGRSKLELPANFPAACHEWLERKTSLIEAAGRCEMSVSTFWKRAKELEEKEKTAPQHRTFEAAFKA